MSVHDICDGGELTAETGYIMTPQYPLRYPASRNCSVRLRAHPSQRLRLHIIDMDLVKGIGPCNDYLYMLGQLRSTSICGTRSRVEGFTTTDGSYVLDLTFHSDGHNQSRGFWLHYQGENLTPVATFTNMD